MTIIDKRNKNVEFSKLECGQVFTNYDEEIWMKTEGTNDDDYGNYDNAVNLKDGSLYYFKDDAIVTVLKVHLTLE